MLVLDHYAVIGNPISHSRSPWIHRRFAENTNQSLEYTARLAPLEGFEASVAAFREEGGLGLNVTVPFKTHAFKLATQHSTHALQAEAVNTLIWTGTHWRGDNTDGIGLCRDLLHEGFMITGQRIVILGAGGAVQGLLPILLELAPSEVIVVNRTLERAQALVHRLQTTAPTVKLSAQAGDAPIEAPVNGIIQATSTALQHGQASFNWPSLSTAPQAWCYDLVYGPAAQATKEWATSHHLRFADGLGMLVEQAAESFWLWRNIRPETRSVLAELRTLIEKTQSETSHHAPAQT